ncbi:MAG TPA: hypothetical protein VF250_06250 [Conexibacter sp.]
MFPFRPSRAATALLELAEAMLAPKAFDRPHDDPSRARERVDEATPRRPHRRGAAIERRRRPAPPQPEQACVAPLTRAGRARETVRS